MVNFSGLSSNSSQGDLIKLAQEFIKALNSAPPIKSINQGAKIFDIANDIHGVVSTTNITTNARNAFIFEIGRNFGGVSAFSAINPDSPESILLLADIDDEQFDVDGPSDLMSIVWSNTLAKFDVKLKGSRLYGWQPTNGTIAIPISRKDWVVEGETYTYNWQAFKQNSTAKGEENYVDVYVSTELGLKAPIIDSVLTFDAKFGRKTGEKSYTKTEDSSSIRIGTQISKAFVMQKLIRNTVILSGQQKTWSDEMAIETGYQIIPKEGGDTLGPFWPWYLLNGKEIPDSSLIRATKQLKTVLEETALEVAKRAALML
jgi:hypothetical protein